MIGNYIIRNKMEFNKHHTVLEGTLANGVFTATNNDGSAMIQFSVADQNGFYNGNSSHSIDGTPVISFSTNWELWRPQGSAVLALITIL